jgi:hypothetical protein
MDINRKQPDGRYQAGTWVNKPDPFYPTYTKENIARFETYAEWLRRIEKNPSNFEISSKVCIPGGYQDRGYAPVTAYPLASKLP